MLTQFLPDSPFYSILSELPPPDATNPTATATFFAQSAVHNSLPILEEMTSIHENDEEKTVATKVHNLRQRIGAGSPEQIRKDVDREVLGESKVIRGFLPVLFRGI